MENLRNDWTAYSLAELNNLADESTRLNKTDILERYLVAKGYKKEADNLYSLSEPEQLIEVFKTPDGIIYQNQMKDDDQGTFIDFIIHRLPDEGRINTLDFGSAFALFPSAALAGLHFEKTEVATPLKPERESKPNILPKEKRRKGKRL